MISGQLTGVCEKRTDYIHVGITLLQLFLHELKADNDHIKKDARERRPADYVPYTLQRCMERRRIRVSTRHFYRMLTDQYNGRNTIT